MTNDGSRTPLGHAPQDEDETIDTVPSLVQMAVCRPPYDAVRWDTLAERIVASAQDDLARRRGVVGLPSGTGLRRGVRAWWEVTAGWARPALAAAVTMIAVAAALMIATPAAPSAGTGGDGTIAGTLTASTDAMDAVMLGTPSTLSVESSPVTRDSLFSTLVDER
jgi:hypothetical protein